MENRSRVDPPSQGSLGQFASGAIHVALLWAFSLSPFFTVERPSEHASESDIGPSSWMIHPQRNRDPTVLSQVTSRYLEQHDH